MVTNFEGVQYLPWQQSEAVVIWLHCQTSELFIDKHKSVIIKQTLSGT